MISLPNETLFHCVSGESSLNRTSIRNFGFYCRNLRGACTSLRIQIDTIWKNVLRDSPELQSLSSFRSVVRWIDGKPKITNPTLQEVLKVYFGIEIEPDVLTRKIPSSSIPYYWPSEELLIFINHHQDLEVSFFNCKTSQLLKEDTSRVRIEDCRSLVHLGSEIQPIISENNAFILASQGNKYKLCHYILGQEQASLIKTIPLPIDCDIVQFMELIDNHVVIQTTRDWIYSTILLAIAIVDLVRFCSPTFIRSDKPLKLTPTKLSNNVLLRSKKEDKFCFHKVQIKDREIELQDLTVKGDLPPNQVFFSEFSSYMHVKDKHEIFQFNDGNSSAQYTFGFISAENPSNTLSLVQIEKKIDRFRHLLKFKDGILSVFAQGNKIKIESVDIAEGQVVFTPMDISGMENESLYLYEAYCHLDKLFLFGNITLVPYMLVINLHSKLVEHKSRIKPFFEYSFKIIEARPGCILIFNTSKNNILKINYT